MNEQQSATQKKLSSIEDNIADMGSNMQKSLDKLTVDGGDEE